MDKLCPKRPRHFFLKAAHIASCKTALEISVWNPGIFKFLCCIYLQPFHRRIKFEFNKPNQFVAVAEYIKRYGFNSEESIFDSLTLIAKEALNDPEARNVLEISIRCYMSSTPLYSESLNPNLILRLLNKFNFVR